MQRVNGFLNVEDYFVKIQEKYNLSYSELTEKGYITPCEFKSGHFWLNIDNQDYYFKDTSSPYHELIVYYLAKYLGINVTEVDLAYFNGSYGIISKNFHKENANYISGFELLDDYLKNNKEMCDTMGLPDDYKKVYLDPSFVHMNNLTMIWQALEYRYKNNSHADIKKLMNQIIDIYFLQLITNNRDLVSHNWEIEEEKDDINICPSYDNEMSFTSSTVSLSTNFNDMETYTQDSILEFFKISSKENIDYILEKFNKVNKNSIKDLIMQIESYKSFVLPENIKNDILSNWEENLINIKNAIKSKGR